MIVNGLTAVRHDWISLHKDGITLDTLLKDGDPGQGWDYSSRQKERRPTWEPIETFSRARRGVIDHRVIGIDRPTIRHVEVPKTGLGQMAPSDEGAQHTTTGDLVRA